MEAFLKISGNYAVWIGYTPDIGKAMEIAREKYKMGIFVVEPDGYPTAKLMMAEDEYGVECTEWEEFE